MHNSLASLIPPYILAPLCRPYCWNFFLPYLLFLGNLALLLFGIFFTMAAAGDFRIVDLLKKENKDDLVQDYPSGVGYFIYRKKINGSRS